MSQVSDQQKLIAANTTYNSVTQPVYNYATTTQPGVVYGSQSTYSNVPVYNQAYQTTTVGGYSRVGQSLTQKVVAEEIPVESRIEYIPFEKKYIEYDQIERI